MSKCFVVVFVFKNTLFHPSIHPSIHSFVCLFVCLFVYFIYLFIYLFVASLNFSTAICSTPDWLRYQNSCFKKFTEEVNWLDAQQSCLSISSNLTSIHSAEENVFVRNVVSPGSSSIWIGLNNLNSADGSYEWADGSNLAFKNWTDGEPNNNGPGGIIENCTEFNSAGAWNDLNCSYHSLSYVCGKKWNS